MKDDMSGAAACLGAFEVWARLAAGGAALAAPLVPAAVQPLRHCPVYLHRGSMQ